MNQQLHFAFVGNPNSGKTTLFNAYTGAKLKVGNWPGVTVEKKEATINHQGQHINMIDLPGIYSLSTYSIEEKLTRQYIIEENVDVIINIVDASNLERNLFLTLQLIELGKPIVIALNMMDIAEQRDIQIDINRLSKELNIPIIPVVATKKKGLTNLLDKAADISNSKLDLINVPYSRDIEDKINILEDKYYQEYSNSSEFNLRWLAIKYLESDEEIVNRYPLNINESFGKECEQNIIEQKYDFIHKIITKTVKYEYKETTTDKVDKILTHRILGLPIFFGIMAFVFFLTFNVGNIFAGYFEEAFALFSEGVRSLFELMEVPAMITSLVADGIIAGVGGVLVFLPNIFILFLAMAILEDSGYMARVAYIMDDIMRKIGLSGKAFIPMLLGFGCSVPAIMTARTLENPKDRYKIILMTPFMSCNAKFPIYVLFSNMFFPGKELLVTYSLYLLGILIAIITALVMKKYSKKSDIQPLLLELPDYKAPAFRTTGIYVLEKVKGYLIKAGTVIFLASIIIWAVLNFNINGMVTDMSQSFGAIIGKAISPLFILSGFPQWQAVVSLIAGIAGKEIVVSSMSVLYGLTDVTSAGGLSTLTRLLTESGFTALSAYSFMVFCLLYTPCVATIGAIKRETESWKWALGSMLFQLSTALVVSIIVYQIGTLIF